MKKRFFTFLFCGIYTTFSFSQKNTPPKLIVGIVIDQMCYDYLYRYYTKFSQKGFRKIMEKGTNCRNTQYNYIPTFTGPGHASIYTGTTPSNHGIVANDWFDRTTKKDKNCVEDTSVTTIGSSSTQGLCSPKNLQAFTITDQLRITYPTSKVISLSIKNRGAILPGGHKSNGSYWYDYTTGDFITSSYYEKEIPQWLQQFNAKKMIPTYMNTTWNTLYPLASYTESTQDDSPYEELIFGNTKPTFPYDFSGLDEAKKIKAFTATPFANSHLLNASLEAIIGEKLGRHATPDFLCISFSSTDILGHAYGPQSIEIEDMYLRLDLEIARLLDFLDDEIGKNEYTLFITADHAVVPVPQLLVDNKLPGGYFYSEKPMKELREKCIQKYGFDCILDESNNNIYIDKVKLKEKDINIIDVQNYIKDQIKQWSNIKNVYTGEELENSEQADYWKNLVKSGYVKEESGDVIYTLNSGFLPYFKDTEKSHKGTSHGSGYSYDTHVPLLWYGRHIPKKEIFRRVEITSITATLVHLLNLSKPSMTIGEPILEITNYKRN
jgi:predicted AlkP superfamily pyrophosphatase or phosphodiesterase